MGFVAPLPHVAAQLPAAHSNLDPLHASPLQLIAQLPPPQMKRASSHALPALHESEHA